MKKGVLKFAGACFLGAMQISAIIVMLAIVGMANMFGAWKQDPLMLPDNPDRNPRS